jgi:hypothetical protein
MQPVASPLGRWVTSIGGIERAGKLLKVSKHTVRYWLKRRGPPKTVTALKIVELSNGELTFQSILESTMPRSTKRGAK